MPTIGTAGHIDHGKSALVKALGSIDPDRLPEEKRRGITIDLGFAWFETEQCSKIGIIDVPGHENYVNNAIPGLSGVDGVLFVVAADDGWMPQTEEHLQIINFLHVGHGIVALTKIDLVDEDWLQIVEEDICEHLKGSVLANAPIIRVSVRTGVGLYQLRSALNSLACELPVQRDIHKPRLPIDRVFAIKGSGVVVTGTLHGGSLTTGSEVLALPQGIPGYIRSIESYKQAVPRAMPGDRVAVNLAGVKRDDVERGTTLVTPEVNWKMANIIDTEIKLLPRYAGYLKNGSEVSIHLETNRASAKVKVIGQGPDSLFVRFFLHQPASPYLGERFIIRWPSPPQTIGGGQVLDISPRRLRVKEIPTQVKFLERRHNFDTASIILTEIEKHRYVKRDSLLTATLLDTKDVQEAVDSLAKQKRLVLVGPFAVDLSYYNNLVQQTIEAVEETHRNAPLERGIPQVSLQSRLHLDKAIFDSLVADLVTSGKLTRNGDYLALKGYCPRLSSAEEAVASRVLELLRRPIPPTRRELAETLPQSEAVVRFLCQQGTLVDIGEGVLLPFERYQDIKRQVNLFLQEKGNLSIQDMHSLFGLSRRYIIPLLNRFDHEGITRREGDVRVSAQ